jgi:hypothetical protein
MQATSTTPLLPSETLRQVSEPLPELYQKLTSRRDALMTEAEGLMRESEEAGKKAEAVFDFAAALKIDLTTPLAKAEKAFAGLNKPAATFVLPKALEPGAKLSGVPPSGPTPLTTNDIENLIANDTPIADQCGKSIGTALGVRSVLMVIHKQWPNRTIGYEAFSFACKRVGNRTPAAFGTWRKALLPLYRSGLLKRLDIKHATKRSTFSYYWTE